MEYRDPAVSKRQIEVFAHRVNRRLFAVGDKSMPLDDIRQELWIAWTNAVQSYKPESGVPFGAYLQRGMALHVRSWMRKTIEYRLPEVHAVSIDYTADGSDGEALGLHESVASSDDLPDQEIERRSNVKRLCEMLSPVAAKFVEILYTQPPELVEELVKVYQRADYGREAMNVIVPVQHRLTKNMIFDLLDVPRHKRDQVLAEIDRKIETLSKRTA